MFEFFHTHEHYECMWLKSLIERIKSSCDIPRTVDGPRIIYKNIIACSGQVKGG